jgi:membrane protease YdiL (CAAX protease family)
LGATPLRTTVRADAVNLLVIRLNYPVAMPPSQAPPLPLDAMLEIAATKPPPWRWKFWGTIFWSIALMATFIVVATMWLFALATWIYPDPDIAADSFGALLQSHQGPALAGFAVAAACAFGVMAFAIRLTGIGMRAYLGLIPPRARDLGAGLAGFVAIYLAFWLGSYLYGHPPLRYVANLYREARADGSLPLLLFGVVVAAPFGEELLIRGFLYGGWAASRLGPAGAIVLTSLVWTFLHTQYDWLILTELFCIGLLLGWIRRRGGSTTATMILHAVQNAWSIAYFAVVDAMGLIPGP